MYKITDNLQQINQINIAVAVKEGKTENKYCDINKHCREDLYAIPIIEGYLRTLSEYCEFINDEWLTTDLVEKLPFDWTWNFPERTTRVTIPLEIQAKALVDCVLQTGDKYDLLGQILNVVYPTIAGFIIPNSSNVVVYLEYIEQQHRQVLEMFNEIKIEE